MTRRTRVSPRLSMCERCHERGGTPNVLFEIVCDQCRHQHRCECNRCLRARR